MDPFEYNEFAEESAASEAAPRSGEDPSACSVPAEEPAPQPPVQENPYTYSPSSYHGTGAGRKESPYANSPYVRNTAPREEYRYQPQTQPPVKPPKVKKERKPIRKGILAAILTVALVAGGCLITGLAVTEYWEDRNKETVDLLTKKIDALQEQINNSTLSPGAPTVQSPISDGSTMTPSQLYHASVNSVVAISSTVQTNGFYGSSEGASSGSGFILTADGYVVTNYHVVEGATKVDVILHDDTSYTAKVVGHDATNDIAVLKVEATGLPAATLGSSNALAIGDMVAAIGNPLGELAATQTIGYVSGINREVSTDNTIISMIQTDAAINPGNSGGPLFNMRGEVIGITTAKYSGTTGSGASIEGIGFAIPIDDVIPIIHDLIDYGYVTGAYMGVTVMNTDADSAAMFGLPTGAYIMEVQQGGSADRAGIQPKDIVIDLGGHKVGSITDLTRALRNFKAGDTTTVTVIRGGEKKTMDITLDEKPQQTAQASTPAPEGQMPDNGDYDEWYKYFSPFFGD